MTEAAPEVDAPGVNLAEMTDDEVLTMRNQLAIEADRRIKAMSLRDDTLTLAQSAKELGRSKEEVVAIVTSVVDEVYAEPVADEPAVDEQPPESS